MHGCGPGSASGRARRRRGRGGRRGEGTGWRGGVWHGGCSSLPPPAPRSHLGVPRHRIVHNQDDIDHRAMLMRSRLLGRIQALLLEHARPISECVVDGRQCTEQLPTQQHGHQLKRLKRAAGGRSALHCRCLHDQPRRRSTTPVQLRVPTDICALRRLLAHQASCGLCRLPSGRSYASSRCWFSLICERLHQFSRQAEPVRCC